MLRKVNQTFSALGGAFGPFDEVAVFTYGNTVSKRQDFGNSTRMEMALQRIKDESGTQCWCVGCGRSFWFGTADQ